MMHAFLSAGLMAAALVLVPLDARAQSTAPQPQAEAIASETLLEALGMPELLPIMRQEGMDYALELEDEMFPGRGGAEWEALVRQIYAADRIKTIVNARFTAEIADTDLGPLHGFFTSDIGRQIVTLEISAREAMLDDAVEEMSRDSYARMRERDAPRLALIEAFVAANGLIETNVVGALNSNFAFYEGLAEGGAFTFEMTEEQMLEDVWGQEPEIRAETEEWVFSYLSMAYQPLEDADIEAYVAMSRTPEGKALNRALFAAFDELFVVLSKDLGLGVARFMAGEDI